MIHNIMPRELAPKLVETRFVGHKMALARNVLAHDRRNFFFGGVLDMEATGRAATLDKGQDGVLVAPTAFDFDATLATDIGFVHLNDARQRRP